VKPRRNGDSAKAVSNESAVQSELQGFVDIGMARDACRVAREVLAQKRISSGAFNAVVAAIEIVSDPKKWLTELEVAWARQSAAFQRDTNWMMLALYASADNWEKALRHAAPRRLRRPSDFLFGIEALLRAGQTKEATKAVRKAWQVLDEVDDEFDHANLIEALASYYARVGNHDQAFKLWSVAPRNQPFGRNAAEGRIELCLAHALGIVREELTTLSDLPIPTENDLALPGNDKSIRHDTEAALKKWQRAIEKLLPEKRWQELGISET
jgi:tetratricopeptide (TPR) repeat protein